MRRYKVMTHDRSGSPRWFIIPAESMQDAVDLLTFSPGYVSAIRSSDGKDSIVTYGETTICCYYNDNKQGRPSRIAVMPYHVEVIK